MVSLMLAEAGIVTVVMKSGFYSQRRELRSQWRVRHWDSAQKEAASCGLGPGLGCWLRSGAGSWLRAAQGCQVSL